MADGLDAAIPVRSGARDQGRDAVVLPQRRRYAHRFVRGGRYLFLLFATLVLSGVNAMPNVDSKTELQTDALAPIFHAIMLAGTVVFALSAGSRLRRGIRRAAPFLLILGYCALSIGWSEEPLAVFRATLSLAQVMLLAIVAYTTLGTTAICRIQVQAMVLAAIVSLVVAWQFPASGYDTGDNAAAMRGVFTQKNQLGQVMVGGLIALSYLVLRTRRFGTGAALVAGLALALIVLARSITSLALGSAVIVATIAALSWTRRRRLAGPMLAAMGVMLAVATVFGAIAYPVLLDLVGKDVTLTGRTGIWQIIIATIGRFTLLGAGYATFWLPGSADAQLIWHRIGFVTQSAHSGYLEVLLELGILGLSLFAVAAVTTLGRVARGMAAGARVGPAWLLIVIGFVLLFNVDEVSWPRADLNLFEWMLAFLGCRYRSPVAARSKIIARRAVARTRDQSRAARPVAMSCEAIG